MCIKDGLWLFLCLSLTPFSPSYIFLNIKKAFFILEFVLIRTGFQEILKAPYFLRSCTHAVFQGNAD